MNKLTIQKRAQIIGMLVEGNSLHAVSRMADCSINTVTQSGFGTNQWRSLLNLTPPTDQSLCHLVRN